MNKTEVKCEEITATSPVAIVYFVCLFLTFGMLMLSATYIWKAKKQTE